MTRWGGCALIGAAVLGGAVFVEVYERFGLGVLAAVILTIVMLTLVLGKVLPK